MTDKITIEDSVTFEDVLLLPNYTDFMREDTDTSVELHSNIRLKTPIISSPMDTVTELETAICMAENGGLGILHRSMSVADQSKMVKDVKSAVVYNLEKSAVSTDGSLLVGAAVGIGADFEERVKALAGSGVDLLLVDSAHGHSKIIMDCVKNIKKWYPNMPVMAGNITTEEAANDLIDAGADILRVGMGPGSICTTRIVTGMGVPQLTAVGNVARAAHPRGAKVIADGGVKQIGDIAKAIGFGAHAVMLGSMLAGFDQSPGDKIEIDGKICKSYRGMGSISAMQKGGAARYGQKETKANKLVAEGVEGVVKYKGDLSDFLFQIDGGVRSSMFYVGGQDLPEFYAKAKFVKVTPASIKESNPHSITVTGVGSSYQVS